MAKRPRLRSGFTLGGEQAEADHLLADAFFESSDYEVLQSTEDRRCFLIGRTGAGKSAALQHLEESKEAHVIRINPEDLSLPYITDLQVIKYLDQLQVNLDLFWIALWKHVLLVEIIRHRYQVNSAQAKQNFMTNLRAKISRDSGKIAALEYLDEFEGRFWCEADERVREITDKFTSKVEAAGKLGGNMGPLNAELGGGATLENSSESRTEQVDRYQRIVNDTQLGKLNTMIGVLNEEILDDQHFTYVVIDDLDRDWIDERVANDLIRCLFRTVLDLKRVENLKVLVALRTNIFQELDFGSRSGGQEEKFRSLVLQMRWTRPDLEDLLDERVRVAADRVGLVAQSLQDLLPNANRTRGNPVEYILDRTLLRPRDAIAFANEAVSIGVGKTRLTWEDIRTAERSYSSKRLLALRDEWKPTYPGIDQVLTKFRGVPNRMTKAEFEKRLDDAMLLISEPSFLGVRWLTDVSSLMWMPGTATWFELYQPLMKLLYVIGFVGCSTRDHAAPTFFNDDSLFVDLETNVMASNAFYVHRTYQAALDINPASGF
jgi:hypothetical protein